VTPKVLLTQLHGKTAAATFALRMPAVAGCCLLRRDLIAIPMRSQMDWASADGTAEPVFG